ncbi:CopG family transcriptional regulator [Luteimonas sp. BDR2-5]|uniref:CopG family transcriptional regulator n=1 Tax=Proluteimonas luteida TaxID=2878685 RepID=UPI001E51A820|nr:CopG family transcriptional regulator [Luteimonas sp. BDR2-5]MCD9026634.1 CopG family transcriptional regulator [Luteimonas sp. BDR2-5]
MSRVRRNVYFEHAHDKRLSELAAMKGVSVSGIVAAAVAAFLSPEGDGRELVAKRLDRLSCQFERLERDQAILIEALALYVRYYLTVSAPLPEAHQAAAKAQGQARFAQFVEQLGRRIGRGHSLVRELATVRSEDETDAAAAAPGESA